MKKLFALLLAMAMVLSLTACSDTGKVLSEDNDQITEMEEPEEGQEEPKEEETPAEEEPEAPAEEETPAEEPAEEPVEETPAEEPAQEETEEPAPEESASGDEIVLGTINGNVYENASLGYGCELDETWMFYTDEQMEAMNQISIEAFDDEEIQEQLANVDMFYDMIAQPADGLGMVQVAVENLGVLYGTIIDLDTYIEATLESLESSMPSAGYSNILVETRTVEFAGQEMTAIAVSGDLSEIAVYQLMVPVKVGNHVVLYAAASYMQDTTSDILACFYALD